MIEYNNFSLKSSFIFGTNKRRNNVIPIIPGKNKITNFIKEISKVSIINLAPSNKKIINLIKVFIKFGLI